MADVENNTPSEHQPTEVEQRAMEQGWVPQEQWEGSPDAWRPAKEFLDRGELFRKIDEQKRELKSMKMAMEEFGKHHAKVREIEYQRALRDLKTMKREAIAEGDADAVVEIDDKIDELKEKQREPEPRVQPAEPHPAVVEWTQRNTWYQTNRVMKAAADEVAREMVARGVTDPVQVLSEVDKVIRAEFKDKFHNPNRDKAGAVEGSTNKVSRNKEDSVEMTDEQRRIMNKIIDSTGMSKEQYLKEFKEYNKRG